MLFGISTISDKADPRIAGVFKVYLHCDLARVLRQFNRLDQRLPLRVEIKSV